MEELLSPKELARILKVSQVCVYKWAARGIIPHYKLERTIRFAPHDVLEFIQKRRKVGQEMVNSLGEH